MDTLNKDAALALNDFSISGCTDVTGFGLMGHANEMASGSGRTIVIEGSKVPLLPQAYEMAEMGIVPKGAYNNRNWTSCSVSFGEEVSLALSDVLFDPQTSGGLLISLPETEAQKLIYRLKDTVPVAEIIGYVEKFSGKTVYVK